MFLDLGEFAYRWYISSGLVPSLNIKFIYVSHMHNLKVVLYNIFNVPVCFLCGTGVSTHGFAHAK
jgi:hypothetical protein